MLLPELHIYLLISKTSMTVSKEDLEVAVGRVMKNLIGIDQLFPSQMQLLTILVEGHNTFYTAPTNSGKTLPPVLLPYVLYELQDLGYSYPQNPKMIFLTALNSIKISLVTSMKKLGIDCIVVTKENAEEAFSSTSRVLFVSPEVLNSQHVTQQFLKARTDFVLKTIDECHLGKHNVF